MSSIDWAQYFLYDEASPSCLLRAKAWITGDSKHRSMRAPVGSVAGTQRKDGYWYVTAEGRRYLAHRVVYEIHNGPIPKGFEVDHRDGVPSDSRIAALRLVPKKVNNRNQKKRSTNSSGINGVTRTERYVEGRGVQILWRAYWNELDGTPMTKTFSVGRRSEEEAKRLAVQCRDEALARLNTAGAGYSDQHGIR